MNDATIKMIAHRLNSICHANKILVIAGGGIAQQGTHEKLMQKGGIYEHFVTVRESSQVEPQGEISMKREII